MHRFILSLFFVCLGMMPPAAHAQVSDTCGLRISLLTATPGEELYSTFGHSALRVTDSINHTDIVYNYGTFNFEEPGFYMKFIRGKLNYFLSREYFESFVYAYQMEGRGLTEQVLQLTCAEKKEIFDFLQNNMLPANRFYKYDFLFDNCTTRLRDLIEEATDEKVEFSTILPAPKTFRNLIHDYLDVHDKQWSKLGIDILLGARTDAVMTSREVMFLPDYLLANADSATLDHQLLVKEKNPLYPFDMTTESKNNLTHPLFIFACLFVLIAFLSFSKNTFVQRILFSFDGMLLFITGFLGFLLLFMWFGTDHSMTKNNYNLLWAWPINVLPAFYMHSHKKWVRKYLIVYSVFCIGVVGMWFFLPQQMNPALLPIIGILIFRSFVYISRNKMSNERISI